MAEIQTVVSIFQIVFWCVASVVAVLTYRQARNGLLQPIRTEIFKFQVEEIKNIISHFNGKGEYDLMEECDLDNMILANCLKMYDEYAFINFSVKVDESKRPYNKEKCPTAMVSLEFAIKNFEKMEGHIEDDNEEKIRSVNNKNTWSEYEFGITSITKKSFYCSKNISLMAANPVLPSNLLKCLNDYDSALHENISKISEVLNTAKNQMEEKYPTIEDLKRSQLDWVRSKYIDEIVKLEPIAVKILHEARSYFDPDGINNRAKAKQ